MRLPARLTVIVLAGGVALAPAAVQAAAVTPTAGTAAAASAAPTASATPAMSATPTAASYPSGVQAKGAALENAATGRLLWSREPNAERPMASITKVMTALVVIQAGKLGRRVTVPAAVTAYVRKWGASNAGLHPGDKLTAHDLLEALLLPSGCDAAYALAQAYGGQTAFIARMNAEAARLGLHRTHFANFDGLPWPTARDTYSTPANLLALGRAAMQSAVFRSIVDQRTDHIPAGPLHHAYTWHNTNLLLGHSGVIGVKTGNTPVAGYCLLFEARQGTVTLIGVVLNSSRTAMSAAFSDATKILAWGFAHD
jgi:serine-type D-Ala-D-Ala carboxypeptidase (penicillin-binding protein 5/6)